jgi:transcriptional regulator with XRE-family HTH domain
MCQFDRVRLSKEGKSRLKDAYKTAGFTQENLAERANTAVDTVKRLLETKAPHGAERWKASRIAAVVGLKLTELGVSECCNVNQPLLPEEFKALIEEKTRLFCGRKFVFEAFEQFLEQQPKGYFTVVGEAGMGKSAIAAKYVLDHQAICYFNVLAEGRNRPELFLKSIRHQLIHRYQLEGAEAEKANLATLLEKASQKLLAGERLVIVVDALDEVEQVPRENLLHLPMTLPDRVYFVLTRRPYDSGNRRITVSPGIPVEELDLTKQEYEGFNHADVKAYIHLMLHEELAYRVALQNWIETRDLREEEFVKQVAAKSEKNFMYLRYVLPAIAEGLYDDLTLKQLPQGLQQYYQTHWVRMGMDEATQERMVIVLFILVAVGTPITCNMIAKIAKEEEHEVSHILDQKWREYLRLQEIKQEDCYSIYHASFLDFLKEKGELNQNRRLFQDVRHRRLFQDVKQGIASYLYGEES